MARGALHRLWQSWNGDFNFDKWFRVRARFQRTKNPVAKLWYRHYLMKMNNRYNAFIPPALVIPRSVVFPHGISGIFLSVGCVIGENCVIFQQVTLGSNTLEGSKRTGSPVLEDNVFIGAGARVIGGVTLGRGCRVAAGCALSQDVPPGATALPGKAVIRPGDPERDNSFRTPAAAFAEE